MWAWQEKIKNTNILLCFSSVAATTERTRPATNIVSIYSYFVEEFKRVSITCASVISIIDINSTVCSRNYFMLSLPAVNTRFFNN